MERNYQINKTIKNHIEENAKKQSIVADRAGIRRDVFNRIINCKRPVYADEVPGICSALGVTVDALFAGMQGE